MTCRDVAGGYLLLVHFLRFNRLLLLPLPVSTPGKPKSLKVIHCYTHGYGATIGIGLTSDARESMRHSVIQYGNRYYRIDRVFEIMIDSAGFTIKTNI